MIHHPKMQTLLKACLTTANILIKAFVNIDRLSDLGITINNNGGVNVSPQLLTASKLHAGLTLTTWKLRECWSVIRVTTASGKETVERNCFQWSEHLHWTSCSSVIENNGIKSNDTARKTQIMTVELVLKISRFWRFRLSSWEGWLYNFSVEKPSIISPISARLSYQWTVRQTTVSTGTFNLWSGLYFTL